MKKYLLAFLVIVLLGAGLLVGLLLVQQRQIFNQKASSPTGTATVTLKPALATFQRGQANPISVFFNTNGIAISGITVRLMFSNLAQATASNIQINTDLTSTSDWSCPIRTVSPGSSTTEVDIACVNVTPAGYSNSADTLLATFNLQVDQVPSQNPLTVSFDPTETKITQKSDATDIALTPTSTGQYTITDTLVGSPTPTPDTIVASPTATATSNSFATPTPTATALTAGATNACNGTCGSNSNCNSGLMCYSGFCRNPNCVTDSTCNCATAAPTSTTTSTAAAVATTPAPIPVTGFDAPTIIGATAGILLILLAGVALIL